ncbi:MAG: hypothetical protein R2911_07430 [Caldilineaceae bacterium]
MNDTQAERAAAPAINGYHIKVGGHLDARWHEWLDGLTMTLMEDGNTLFSGPIEDQAALHGILNKIRNLGLTLISVNPHSM